MDRDLVEGVPEDGEIEVQIRDALAWDRRLDASTIRVGVCNGVATLWGYVHTNQEKALAQQIASETRGVTDVANDLQVTETEACS